MYYKDAYAWAYQQGPNKYYEKQPQFMSLDLLAALVRKAPKSIPPSTPTPPFKWPDKSVLTRDFGLRDVPLNNLRKIVIWACLAIAFLGVFGYAQCGFPHGPMVDTGETEEVCDLNDRRCEEVRVYEENTSDLENPVWVGFIRSVGLLVLAAGIIFGVVAIAQSNKMLDRLKSLRKDQVETRNRIFRRTRELLMEGVEVHGESYLRDEIALVLTDAESYLNGSWDL
jgi:hypothetical protein